MCLYERKLLNPKYLPNEKNGGKPPICKDERTKYIAIGCGWCKECRKELANNWKARLFEEIKTNKNAVFVTLTFSSENLEKLKWEILLKRYKGIDGNEIDVNMLAGYAVRKWSERWRKKTKKAPRHWLITELGHQNTERIHLHGLIWGSKETIQKTWQYGWIYCGEWVDERTINYIMKYVTKTDTVHNGYKQKIFTSKGMGKEYVQNMWKHEYIGENTKTWYTYKNGAKGKLPKYYKQKIWNDEEREKIWRDNLDKEQDTIDGVKFDLSEQDDEQVRKQYINTLKSARETNKRAKFGDNKTVAKKYILTDKMTKGKADEVTAVERRQVKKKVKYDKGENGEELNKGMYTEHIILGEYIGTTTDTERKRNQEMRDAEELGVDVRTLRLIRKGIIEKI